MKTLTLSLVLFFFSSLCKADVMALNESPGTQIPPAILKNQHLTGAQQSNVINLPKITIDHIQKRRMALPLESIPATGIGNDPIAALNMPSYRNTYAPTSPNLISTVSPDCIVNRHFLSLSKVTCDRHKRAIAFVFLMNKPKQDPNKPVVSKENAPARLHILGPRRMFPEQKLIENEYPLDVSMAEYADGYAPQEWNLILPNKKPREVRVSLMWSF